MAIVKIANVLKMAVCAAVLLTSVGYSNAPKKAKNYVNDSEIMRKAEDVKGKYTFKETGATNVWSESFLSYIRETTGDNNLWNHPQKDKMEKLVVYCINDYRVIKLYEQGDVNELTEYTYRNQVANGTLSEKLYSTIHGSKNMEESLFELLDEIDNNLADNGFDNDQKVKWARQFDDKLKILSLKMRCTKPVADGSRLWKQLRFNSFYSSINEAFGDLKIFPYTGDEIDAALENEVKKILELSKKAKPQDIKDN